MNVLIDLHTSMTEILIAIYPTFTKRSFHRSFDQTRLTFSSFFFFQLAPIFRFDRIDTITQAMKKVSRDDTMQQNVDVWREIVPIQLASLSY